MNVKWPELIILFYLLSIKVTGPSVLSLVKNMQSILLGKIKSFTTKVLFKRKLTFKFAIFRVQLYFRLKAWGCGCSEVYTSFTFNVSLEL